MPPPEFDFLLETSGRLLLINLSTRSDELFNFFFHPNTQRRLFVDLLLGRVLAHVLGDLRSGRSGGRILS